jgi:O-antigen/teichoic acid export membrane protein
VTNKLPNLCQQLFSKFHLSWQETAVDSINSEDRDSYFSRIMNDLFRIMSSIVILILGFNFVYFKFLFTENYYLGYYLSPILMIAILVYTMAQFLGGIYIAQMKSKSNGSTTVISAIINLIINFMLINKIGLWAAVISTLVAYVILFIIRYHDIRQEIELKFYKNTGFYIVAILYFAIANYANNIKLNIVNILLACIFFAIVNKKYIKLLINKMHLKRH